MGIDRILQLRPYLVRLWSKYAVYGKYDVNAL
jgi:hypothetical protein